MLLRYSILLIIVVFGIKLSAQENSIVITEIMYNPPESNTDTLEFIEIYNTTGFAINLEDYYFEGINLVFEEQLLASESYLVICRNGNAFSSIYQSVAIEWTSGTLKNSGETISIFDRDSNLIDSVAYKTTGSWPKEPNGLGYSLVYCFDETISNDVADNWTISSNYIGAIDSIDLYADLEIECGTISTSLDPINYERFLINGQSILHQLDAISQVRIIDLLGREVYNQAINLSMIELELDTGIYIVQLRNEKEQLSEKIYFQ